MSTVDVGADGDDGVNVAASDFAGLTDSQEEGGGDDDVGGYVFSCRADAVGEDEATQSFEAKDMEPPVLDQIFHIISITSLTGLQNLGSLGFDGKFEIEYGSVVDIEFGLDGLRVSQPHKMQVLYDGGSIVGVYDAVEHHRRFQSEHLLRAFCVTNNLHSILKSLCLDHPWCLKPLVLLLYLTKSF